ncbi:MAG TPA: tetratricopeptide repeat protein [Polyangiaceae bacterium]|nr:tetratricopeptide repeat protein [Polyangiaceae bacterium]
MAFAFVCSVGWVASPAFAQSGSSKATAEALFTEGRALASSGKCDEAIPKFQASQKLDPGVGTLLNLAECYEQVGRTASAWAEYREVISLARLAGSKEREELATQKAKALEPKLSRLAIKVTGDASGLTITRDGEAVEAAELGVAIPVDPGQHVIEASAPGKQKFSQSIEVGKDADSKVVEIPALAEGGAAVTEPTDEAAKSGSSNGSTQRTIGLVLGGVGIVGVAVGAIFGLQAGSKWDDAKAKCDDYPYGCGDDGVKLADDANSAATISTIGFIAGGVLIAGGATLWLTAGSGDDKAVAVGVGPGTLRIKGRF